MQATAVPALDLDVLVEDERAGRRGSSRPVDEQLVAVVEPVELAAEHDEGDPVVPDPKPKAARAITAVAAHMRPRRGKTG